MFISTVALVYNLLSAGFRPYQPVVFDLRLTASSQLGWPEYVLNIHQP